MAPKKPDTSAHDAAPKSFIPLVRRTLPPAPIPAPISTFLSQRTLVETIDTHLSHGVADMHLRTTLILNRTCHPPTSPLSFVTIATSSTPTDMTLYAIDIDTSFDPLHSYFRHYTEATWDVISTASPPSLSNLYSCMHAWITTPSKPLNLAPLLHDILAKADIPRGGLGALLNFNIVDSISAPPRYADHTTTSIFAQCVYLVFTTTLSDEAFVFVCPLDEMIKFESRDATRVRRDNVNFPPPPRSDDTSCATGSRPFDRSPGPGDPRKFPLQDDYLSGR